MTSSGEFGLDAQAMTCGPRETKFANLKKARGRVVTGQLCGEHQPGFFNFENGVRISWILAGE